MIALLTVMWILVAVLLFLLNDAREENEKLRNTAREENDRLRKELAELKPQLTRAEAAGVNLKSLYGGVRPADEEWHNTFGVSSPEEEKRLIASMSAYLAKEIDDEIQKFYPSQSHTQDDSGMV